MKQIKVNGVLGGAKINGSTLKTVAKVVIAHAITEFEVLCKNAGAWNNFIGDKVTVREEVSPPQTYFLGKKYKSFEVDFIPYEVLNFEGLFHRKQTNLKFSGFDLFNVFEDKAIKLSKEGVSTTLPKGNVHTYSPILRVVEDGFGESKIVIDVVYYCLPVWDDNMGRMGIIDEEGNLVTSEKAFYNFVGLTIEVDLPNYTQDAEVDKTLKDNFVRGCKTFLNKHQALVDILETTNTSDVSDDTDDDNPF